VSDITKNEYMPILGYFLGDFTDELGKGFWIIEFVSGGPKNYAYRLNDGSTDCVVKGYSINYLTSLILNFETIKKCVDKETDSLTIPQLKFIKDKSSWQIKTCVENKTYDCMSYNKRLLLENGSTLPFGFISS
jgi:hypothetical protein